VPGDRRLNRQKEDTVAVMRAVGYHPLPPHARVRTTEVEYVVELDVADFTAAELTVEALGPAIAVRGEQIETEADSGQPFRIRERLEETFRLPDDVDLDTLDVRHKHGILELHATRTRLEARRLPIDGGTTRLINPDAEAV
jgi:HSP20 family molecular chaperone IbpA